MFCSRKTVAANQTLRELGSERMSQKTMVLASRRGENKVVEMHPAFGRCVCLPSLTRPATGPIRRHLFIVYLCQSPVSKRSLTCSQGNLKKNTCKASWEAERQESERGKCPAVLKGQIKKFFLLLLICLSERLWLQQTCFYQTFKRAM